MKIDRGAVRALHVGDQARIGGCMVTSSAVVGSSAITRRGLLRKRQGDQHALAHAAGQLMRILRQQLRGARQSAPPSAWRRARSRRALRLRSPSRARCSSNCAPMVRTGLSAVIGACGMKAMARPSSARRAPGAMRARSSPSNSSDPDVMAKPAGKELRDGAADHGFSGAGFADQAEDFSRRQVERQRADRRHDGAADAGADHRGPWLAAPAWLSARFPQAARRACGAGRRRAD